MRGPAIHADSHAAHLVVRAGRDFHAIVHQVEAVIVAALHHAGEAALDERVVQMADVDVDAAARRAAAGHDLQVAGARDHVAGGAFHLLRIVALHVALAQAVEEARARAAQAFLEQAAGGDGAAHQQAGRMELQHLHVDESRAGAEAHRHAVAGLFERGRGDAVHVRAAAGGEQRGPRAHAR